MAAEHASLSDASAASSSYDAKAAKRIGELSRITSALRELESAESSLAELRALLASPDEDDAELRQMAHEEMAATEQRCEQRAQELSAELTPQHPFAAYPCLLEIRPGPGGVEGRLFADALVRMYRQYCARKGLRCNMIKYEVTDDGTGSTGAGGNDGGGKEQPLAEAVLEVEAEGAYGMFRGEAGMHRVQRVPATESHGRTHTSAVAVWVLPSFPDDAAGGDYENPDSLLYLDAAEVKIEKMRARGAGGQHVNKTESAIRLTHEPTGIVVSMQDYRSQQQNRTAAWKLLRSRVAQVRREAREKEAAQLRNSVLAKHQMTRADKIRTYNFGQDRCSDHRPGLDLHNLPDILEGGEGLDTVMESVREWLTQRDIESLLAEEEAAAAGQGAKGK